MSSHVPSRVGDQGRHRTTVVGLGIEPLDLVWIFILTRDFAAEHFCICRLLPITVRGIPGVA